MKQPNRVHIFTIPAYVATRRVAYNRKRENTELESIFAQSFLRRCRHFELQSSAHSIKKRARNTTLLAQTADWN